MSQLANHFHIITYPFVEAFGFIFYTLIKLVRGKTKEVPILMYILSCIFLLMYILKIVAA